MKQLFQLFCFTVCTSAFLYSCDTGFIEIEKEEILNDLIIAAYNDCRDKLKKKTSEELLKATGGIKLPF